MTSQLVISQAIPVPAALPGLADIVGFGDSGVTILRNRIDPKEQFVIANFGQNAGAWTVDRHVRLLADTTGDGSADIIGFGETGVYVSLNLGNNTFGAPNKVRDDFAYSAGGWRVDQHLRFMVDLRNTGRADIIGFGAQGIFVSLNNGGNNFGPSQLVLNDFGVASGWTLAKHLRFVADVNGDAFSDIIGFGDSNISVSLSNGDGTFQPAKAVLQDLTYSQGWRVDQNPRFITELNGDGKVDIIGFGAAGVYISLNNGDGTFQPARLVLNDFSTQAGWDSSLHQRSVADITGDGRADIIGFKDDGVHVAINNGDGTFQASKFVLNNFGTAQNWKIGTNPRFLADMTGNGVADIVGFGTGAVWVGYNLGNGSFSGPVDIVDDFGSSSPGWSNTTTVKYVTNLYH